MVKPSAAPHMAAATETRSCVRTGANRKGGESQEMGTHSLHNIAALAVHHLVWLCTTNVNTARSPIERTRSPLRRSSCAAIQREHDTAACTAASSSEAQGR